MFLGDLSDCREVQKVHQGVGRGFCPDTTGIRADGRAQLIEVTHVDELDVHALG